MTQSFVSYISGFLFFFGYISVYMILNDNPIISLIFQKVPNIIQEFIIG